MPEKEMQQQPIQTRILILCVDRDGDLEFKSAIKTPLLGRTANLDAAVSLALKDPEESDANAMFEAVRLYDRLQNEKKPEEIFEVATISGSELGGVSADRKLVSELGNLLDTFNADEVILVSDGYSDEAILPLVQSRVPVSSVRRIVIKHSESIEETAAIFSKYTRLLVNNPRYARITLGVPGLLVFIFGVLWALNYVFPGAIFYYGIAIVIILGGLLLVKGFGIDKALKDAIHWFREYSPPSLPVIISNFTIFAGALCVAISIYLGAQSVSVNVVPFPSDVLSNVNNIGTIVGYFIKGMINLAIVGVILMLIGRSIRFYAERDSRLLRNVALIVLITWCRWILDETANLLITPGIELQGAVFSNFIFSIIIGILIGIASVLLIYVINRSAKGFFVKTDEKPKSPSEK